MAHFITGIDHALIAVRQLDQAAAEFARLGFALSPKGGHAEWATANHCIMFARDYLELIAPAGNGPGADKVTRFLDANGGDGLMGLALASQDAEGSYRGLTAQGVAAVPPAPLSRSLHAPDGEVLPRFSLVDLPPDATPGVPSFLCQHLTPDLLRRPQWLDHPNGAQAIQSVTVVVEDPQSLMPAYDKLFGMFAATPTDDMVTVHTGGAMIFLVTPDGFDHLHPNLDMDPPKAPSLASLCLTVASLDRAAAVLKANGVSFRHKPDQIAIDPEEALGVAIEMIEA